MPHVSFQPWIDMQTSAGSLLALAVRGPDRTMEMFSGSEEFSAGALEELFSFRTEMQRLLIQQQLPAHRHLWTFQSARAFFAERDDGALLAALVNPAAPMSVLDELAQSFQGWEPNSQT